MRGIFTAGVLDSFIEKELEFPYVIGVSMGAYIGASYITKQRYRAFKVLTYSTHNKEFIDFKRVLYGRPIVDPNFIFNNIDKKLFPFKFDKFHDDTREFVSVATNCFTGKSEYLYKSNFHKNEYEKAIMASCAYPVLTDIVYFNDIPYLDGGISDSIPIEHVLKKNKRKIVIILTHPKGFRESSLWYYTGSKIVFKNYPKVAKAILNRSLKYNKSLDLIEELEEEGKVFVIRPSKMEMEISDADTSKIIKHYEMGFQCGLSKIKKLKEWLSN